MSVIQEIADERARQVRHEGWDLSHDDEHTDGSLAQAAACYAMPDRATEVRATYEYPGRGECDVQIIHERIPLAWPHTWHPKWWKPKNRRRDLVRAAALIVAEIERLDRAAGFRPGLRRPRVAAR